MKFQVLWDGSEWFYEKTSILRFYLPGNHARFSKKTSELEALNGICPIHSTTVFEPKQPFTQQPKQGDPSSGSFHHESDKQ